jgi:hypothetical protein
MNQPRRRPLSLDGHLERIEGDLHVQRRAHAPADDVAGEEVEHGGQVQPAVAGRDVGEIGQPDLVRRLGGEVVAEPIRRDWIAVAVVGRAHTPGQGRQAPQAGPTHQPLDP